MARLLLVEDDPDNLELLTFILSEKYRVSSCACAADALSALETVKPELLVLDIGMSPVDGVQCLEAIRAVPGYGRIPAIALTGFAREVEREAFLAAGFHAVVTKPILDHQQLFAVLASVLQPFLTASSNDDNMACCELARPFTPGSAQWRTQTAR